ncbi:MAG: hypothetical protein OXU45_05045 [Candidatus Melainabacteria bacterium]|nr:hypothetical protein [Candidatus Melainabacteria bacterium]
MGPIARTAEALPQHFARQARALINQKIESLRISARELSPAVRGTMLNLSRSLEEADPAQPDYPRDEVQKQNKLFARVLGALSRFLASVSDQPNAAVQVNDYIQQFLHDPRRYISFYRIIQAALNHS